MVCQFASYGNVFACEMPSPNHRWPLITGSLNNPANGGWCRGCSEAPSAYRILERIEGGMGVVCRARDQKLERDFAMKVLPQEAD
jgi:hypothetical protein